MQQMHSVKFFRVRAFIFSCYLDGASFAIVPYHSDEVGRFEQASAGLWSQLFSPEAMIVPAQAASELEKLPTEKG